MFTIRYVCLTALAALLPAAATYAAPKVTPTTATQTECHTLTDRYKITVGGVELPVEAFKDVYYVHFSLEGSATVRIDATVAIDSCEVSPAVRNIACRTEGNTVRFDLPGAGWWVVRINGRERIFLLADKPEEAPKEGRGVIDVTGYLTGGGLQTVNIQRALDEAAAKGCTLLFPRGIYHTGTLSIPSRSDVYLADGAIIKGSDNRDDYPTDGDRPEADHIRNKEHYTDNGEWMTFSRLILIDGAHDVTLRGSGIIDGSGAILRAQGKPANLIRVRNSRNVRIEGVILRDPAAWNTHIHYSEDVTVSGVKILNDPSVANTDGIDPDASTDVLVENCFAYCSDDNIAIKTTNNLGLNRDLRGVTVRGCVFLTRKSSLKVGTETKAAHMSEIRFENNDVVECDRALALYCNDGALFENITFIDNRIERNYPDSQRRAIHFKVSERAGKGMIRNVRIERCDFRTAFPKPSEIAGLDAAHTIDGVHFISVTLNGHQVRSAEEMNLKTRFTENLTFE